MPRVYIHASKHGEYWVVQYLEPDLRTSIGRMYHYYSLGRVHDILDRAGADVATREEFDSGIRRWDIGACFLNLTDAQYVKLKRRL